MIFTPDDTLENADWLRSRGWDLPRDKAEFLDAIGGPEHLDAFMALPAAQAMPHALAAALGVPLFRVAGGDQWMDEERDDHGEWSGGAGGGGLSKAEGRAWTGKQVGLPRSARLSKQATGKLGEAIVLEYLKGQGLTDAAHMNVERNNFPIDLVQDHQVIEVKAGLVSNGASAQQWRLTIGEPSKTEKAWLKTASAAQKAAHNDKKAEMIEQRKEGVIKAVSAKVGHEVRLKTMTVLINNHTQVADIFSFDGMHPRIGWNSDQAKAGYVGSFHFGKLRRAGPEDEPRDENGRWTSGGGGGGSVAGSSRKHMSEGVRLTLAAVEPDLHALRDHEELVVVSVGTRVRPAGDVVLHLSGSKNEVVVSDSDQKKFNDAVVTHNHPSGWDFPADNPRRDGQSFSRQDLHITMTNNAAAIRAVAPGHTYTLHRPDKGWPDRDAVIASYNRHDSELFRDRSARIAAKTMTVDEAQSDHYHVVMTRVAAEFGLDYTREVHG